MTKPETLDQLRARLSTEQCGLDTARLLDYIDRLETAVNYLPPRDQIRAVLLDCGYRIKEGQTDLADYVYKAAYVLLNMRRAWGGCWPSRITPAMLTAAEEAYMPFGDMQAAIVAALAHAPVDDEAVTLIKSDTAELVKDLITVLRMPNAEYEADAHNAAVKSLRALCEVEEK